ncbi:BcABA3, partial [Mycena epipterygia]
RDTWYYPPDIAGDLKDVDLPNEVKGEILACAFEYTRCVIPLYTNWDRYIAWMRLMMIAIVCEFKGNMVDVMAGDTILGHSLSGTLAALFDGTPGHEDMAREFRAYLLIASDKASNRCHGELFRRTVNCLAQSPSLWFRLRACDFFARFTIAAALACNDANDVWFSDAEFDMLCEIGMTMYDTVGFYKHLAEGETHNTFAYMPQDMRIQAFRQCREVLWALDATWAHQPKMHIVTNFLRFVGGPIHMMMRRYRFVDEGLTIGKPETEHVVSQTRANFKLWNRVDANKAKDVGEADIQRYRDVLARSEEVLFRGLAEILEIGGDGNCDTCRYRASYGAEATHHFGGVELCDGCGVTWRDFLESFPERAAQVFPEL